MQTVRYTRNWIYKDTAAGILHHHSYLNDEQWEKEQRSYAAEYGR